MSMENILPHGNSSFHHWPLLIETARFQVTKEEKRSFTSVLVKKDHFNVGLFFHGLVCKYMP